MVIYSSRKSRSIVKTFLQGLVCGVISHMIYGLMDNYMLGEKLGVSVWIIFGICTAVYLHRDNLIHYYSDTPDPSINSSKFAPQKVLWPRTINLLLSFTLWLGISLAGISFININPFISLGIAVTGGIILGILTTRHHEILFQAERAYAKVQAS